MNTRTTTIQDWKVKNEMIGGAQLLLVDQRRLVFFLHSEHMKF